MFYILVAGYIFYVFSIYFCCRLYIIFLLQVMRIPSILFQPWVANITRYEEENQVRIGSNFEHNHHSILVLIIIMIWSEWYYQIGSVWVPKARVDKCLLRRQGSYQGTPIVFLGWQRQRLQQRHHRQKQSQRQWQ